jgi:flagellar M-ring protein FliF
MSLRGKLTLAGCALAFLIAVAVIMKMATAPSYTTVMVGVDPQKTTQITAALSQAGIQSEIVNAGTEVRVQKGKEDAARTALATKGLNSAATQPGFADTLDKQKLGASNMQQQIAYQRGLEGEIANAIGQIQGADGATVRLTLPKDELFTSEQQPATAAVLLGTDGTTLDGSSVKGIANLVASSVPGLKPSNVTITANTGTMLWPSGDGSGAGVGGTTKASAEAQRAQAMEAKLNAVLASAFGPGKAQVQVNYDLNMDKSTQEKLQYGKTGVPLHEEVTNETLKGTGTTTGGSAGTQSNVPSYAGVTAGGNGTNNYKQKTDKRDLGVDKTVTKTDVATGAINKMDIGVLLDSSIKLNPVQQAALQKTLQSAAGFQAGRDSFNMTQIAFAKQPAAATSGSPIPPAIAGILKGLGIGIGALLFLFFLTRHLRNRETDELMDEPSWLRQLPRPEEPDMSALAMPEQPTITMATLATEDPRRQALEEIVRNEPEKVAAHLRSWITEDNQ